MAHFEGNYDNTFRKDSLNESSRKEFEQFLKDWRKNHSFGYGDDWIDRFDYDSYKSTLWGFNSPDNIEDLHNFLKAAAKKFPTLEAKGDGDHEPGGRISK